MPTLTDQELDDLFSDGEAEDLYGLGDQPVLDPEVDLGFTTKFLTGQAGTGKTYKIRQAVDEDPKYGILAATTGIAAVNLGTVTLNSLLKFYDTASLEDAFIRGRLQKQIAQNLAGRYKNLIIDEVSMLPAEQLDILVSAMAMVNSNLHKDSRLGLILTGDFLQLPPVKAKWAFEGESWGQFEKDTEVLTKIWRQGDAQFVEGLNLARAGLGGEAEPVLKAAGATFTGSIDVNFDGTTIMAKNAQVDGFNQIRLRKLPGENLEVPSDRWGKTAGEWKNIPERLRVKRGALVMILANDNEQGYANGDLGKIVDWNESEKCFHVELERTGDPVKVGYIWRENLQVAPPQVGTGPDDYPHWSRMITDDEGNRRMNPVAPPAGVYYNAEAEKYCVGGIRYIPIRLGWATSCHKSQGLTLDRVQIDPRDPFFGMAGMAYVALSRARSAEGLRIVAPPGILGKRVKIDPKVRRWA